MNWTDNIVTRCLSKICDLMMLNILWIVCSVPIITIGASTTALYTVTLKLVKNEEGYIARGFLAAFKENLKKSTILWCILAVLGGCIWIDSRLIVSMEGSLRTVFQSVFLLLGFVWLCVVNYAFPLTARYENTVKNTLKNALILFVARLPYTLLMAVVTAGPVILTLLNTRNLMIGLSLWLVIGVALVAWANSFILRKVFEIFQTNEN
ncbi:YesL family protein [Luxibacter massiliensis]|uniref:YesL family protein n=1 Tax=Luxibacter massiliensis TaxID=2219695 RepID=UPI001F39010E|nr:DUF624 domain-containing protein [Luxibacter massiliensis]